MMGQVQEARDIEGYNMYSSGTPLKLARSTSEQNVYMTYVCLVDDIKPSVLKKMDMENPNGYLDGDIEEIDPEDVPIQIERSKAVHELVETRKKDLYDFKGKICEENDPKACLTTSFEQNSSDNFDPNPNILKLTKMKWLTEEQCESPDSSSPSISPNIFSTSTCSRESEDLSRRSVGDKYLSTILRLDREHNLFGLSNIAIVGPQPSRKSRKEDDKPVFPQTAIVQNCCTKGCCQHRSRTDLPSSLKCGGCRSCCAELLCYAPCDFPCTDPCPPVCPPRCPPRRPPKCAPRYPPLRGPCSSCASCVSCPSRVCRCRTPCPPSKCLMECNPCFPGLKVAVFRKPEYEPGPVELTPRSSCILAKPFAARPCTHCPRCLPPSSCFPYLMPCFWPSRAGAPCSVPARCFHNPPCRAARIRRPPEPEVCPPKCEEDPNKCHNQSCPGKGQQMKEQLESRFNKQ